MYYTPCSARRPVLSVALLHSPGVGLAALTWISSLPLEMKNDGLSCALSHEMSTQALVEANARPTLIWVPLDANHLFHFLSDGKRDVTF